jgi:two-component system, response regulator FlrC
MQPFHRNTLNDRRSIGAIEPAANNAAVIAGSRSEPGPDALYDPQPIFAPHTDTRALVGRRLADVERDLILDTLRFCLGNRTRAAKILGVSIRTMRNRLKEFASNGLSIPPTDLRHGT